MPSISVSNRSYPLQQLRRSSLGVEAGKCLRFNAGEQKPQAASFTGVTQASHISDTALNSYENVSQLLMTSVEVKAER